MSARRGRPPAYDRDTAMQAIVETFRQHGFAATSLDDLVSATGMNRPSLFTAFGNKKAMYLAALESFRSTMAEAVGQPRPHEESLQEELKAFFDAAIRFYCGGETKGCLVFCTAPTEASTDSDVRALLTDTISQIESHIYKKVERAICNYEQFDCRDAEVLSKFFSAILISIAIKSRTGINETELQEFVYRSVSLVLHKYIVP